MYERAVSEHDTAVVVADVVVHQGIVDLVVDAEGIEAVPAGVRRVSQDLAGSVRSCYHSNKLPQRRPRLDGLPVVGMSGIGIAELQSFGPDPVPAGTSN